MGALPLLGHARSLFASPGDSHSALDKEVDGTAGLRTRHYIFSYIFIGCEKRRVNTPECLWVLCRIGRGNSIGNDESAGERDQLGPALYSCLITVYTRTYTRTYSADLFFAASPIFCSRGPYTYQPTNLYMDTVCSYRKCL
jgi:hypothetical protein